MQLTDVADKQQQVEQSFHIFLAFRVQK